MTDLSQRKIRTDQTFGGEEHGFSLLSVCAG